MKKIQLKHLRRILHRAKPRAFSHVNIGKQALVKRLMCEPCIIILTVCRNQQVLRACLTDFRAAFLRNKVTRSGVQITNADA